MLNDRMNSMPSKSIYTSGLAEDKAYQNLNVTQGSSSDITCLNLELLSQREIDLTRFLPNGHYLIMLSNMGSMNVKFLENQIQNARYTGGSPAIPKEDIPCIGGLVFVPIRDLTYSDAMKEIKAYIEKVGRRRVYISELAEELQIDMDLIELILNDIRRSSGIDNYV